MFRSRRTRDAASSRPPRLPAGRGRRWGLLLTGALSSAVLAASGLGWSVVGHVNSEIERVDAFAGISDRPRQKPAVHNDGGVNFLLVGVDRRDGLTARDRHRLHAGGSSCNCTDTLMLLHISGDRSRASVVSIPRDSYVEFPAHVEPAGMAPPPDAEPVPASPGEAPSASDDAKRAGQAVRHHGKINSAYAHGGPALTVRTVEQATGLRIDHYLEVNFRSFMKTVDAIGGVEVCSMTSLQDSYSGLDLPRGTSTLDGAGALRYVRARHVGVRSDFGRMERQQHFLVQIIRQLRGSGVLTNPARLTSVVDTVLSSVRADKDLTSADVVTLGTVMRHLTPSGSEFTQVPIADPDWRGDPYWGSAVLWNRKKADRLFDRIRRDQPLAVERPGRKGRKVPIDPRSIRVQVVNASGNTERGMEVDTALARTGFATTGLPWQASGGMRERTVITYDPRWDRSAQSLAVALPGAKLVARPGHGPVMEVTVGSRFRGVVKVRPATSGLTENPDAVTGDQVLCP